MGLSISDPARADRYFTVFYSCGLEFFQSLHIPLKRRISTLLMTFKERSVSLVASNCVPFIEKFLSFLLKKMLRVFHLKTFTPTISGHVRNTWRCQTVALLWQKASSGPASHAPIPKDTETEASSGERIWSGLCNWSRRGQEPEPLPACLALFQGTGTVTDAFPRVHFQASLPPDWIPGDGRCLSICASIGAGLPLFQAWCVRGFSTAKRSGWYHNCCFGHSFGNATWKMLICLPKEIIQFTSLRNPQ